MVPLDQGWPMGFFMHKITVRQVVLDFLKNKGWVFGGVIEDHVHSVIRSKGSTASRVCRKMQGLGELDHEYVKVGSKKMVVRYCLPQALTATEQAVSPSTQVPLFGPKDVLTL